MTPSREGIRRKHNKQLESSTRFGAWSLEKYTHNDGYIVFHWVCGRWIHTFKNNTKNFCPTCSFNDHILEYPDELENCYRIANFDLMTTLTYNTNAKDVYG